MQFAGQRTDMALQPIGEPDNLLLRLGEDVLPDPDAILVTGITPQQTLREGLTEANFLSYFTEYIATPGTIFVGYNSVRFDDEFMRFLHYRNFYDAYEWQWQDKRGRWDMLDVVRMTRALRPDGIQWPVDSEGKATNRLEFLTKVNKLEHTMAHDALSDVRAVIAVAELIKMKQPKLFDFLLKMRDKEAVKALVQAGEPFLYTSGQYASEYEKTTVVGRLAEHPKKQASLVFDLRSDPRPFAAMSVKELTEAWRWKPDPTAPRLPVKVLQYNRCPAVAPLSVLDAASRKRLALDPAQFEANEQLLAACQEELVSKLREVLAIQEKQNQTRFVEDELDVDARLYEQFYPDEDKPAMSAVRAADAEELKQLTPSFKDDRLRALLPLYKARNFASILSDEEREQWETYRERKLLGGKQASRAAAYFKRLGELAERKDLTDKQRFILEELQLYGQSILPFTEGE